QDDAPPADGTDGDQPDDTDVPPDDGTDVPELGSADANRKKTLDIDRLFWVDRTGSILTTGVFTVVVSPTNPDIVFAGGRGFVARSTNRGANWEPMLLLVGSEFSTDSDTEAERIDADEVEV